MKVGMYRTPGGKVNCGYQPCSETAHSHYRAQTGVSAQGQSGGRGHTLVPIVLRKKYLHASKLEIYNPLRL